MDADRMIARLRQLESDYKVGLVYQQSARKALADFLKANALTASQLEEEESPQSAQLNAARNDTEKLLTAAQTKRRSTAQKFPEIVQMSFDEALSWLRNKESSYRILEGQLKAVTRDRNCYVVISGATAEQLARKTSPKAEKLTALYQSAIGQMQSMLDKNNEALRPLELSMTAENAEQCLCQAEQMLQNYQQYVEKLSEQAERRQRKQRQIQQLQEKRLQKSSILPKSSARLTWMERVRQVREEIARAAALRDRITQSMEDTARITAALNENQTSVEAFIEAHCRFEPESDNALAEIASRTEKYRTLAATKTQLEHQRASAEVEKQDHVLSVNLSAEELRAQIRMLEQRRDAMLVEYTQKSEQIRRSDVLLVRYPEVVQ
jgi:hypothetical protein